MQVPFFSREDNLQAFKKMKVMFLINRIRTSDFLIFMIWIFPFILNLIYFIIMMGQNQLNKVFCPGGSIFATDPRMSDWNNRWYGIFHMLLLIGIVCCRANLGINLWKKMKKYQAENQRFVWNKKSKLWWFTFIPFISFVIYPMLLKETHREITHRYNW